MWFILASPGIVINKYDSLRYRQIEVSGVPPVDFFGPMVDSVFI